MVKRPCNGPLCKGKLVDADFFHNNLRKCCRFCLDRNRQWKARHRDKLRLRGWHYNPDTRFRYNMNRIGWGATEKEALSHLLKPGMGWGNYYVKGTRSWRFTKEFDPEKLIAVWWPSKGRIKSGLAELAM